MKQKKSSPLKMQIWLKKDVYLLQDLTSAKFHGRPGAPYGGRHGPHGHLCLAADPRPKGGQQGVARRSVVALLGFPVILPFNQFLGEIDFW